MVALFLDFFISQTLASTIPGFAVFGFTVLDFTVIGVAVVGVAVLDFAVLGFTVLGFVTSIFRICCGLVLYFNISGT